MKLIFLVILTLVTGCASTSHTSQELNWSGNIAYDQMQYDVAKNYYEKAIQLAKSSNDTEYEAIAMYGLAKANGRLCNFKQAESLLKKSIQIRNNLSDTDNAKITQNIFELGRIYIVQKDWGMALVQYEKAVPMLEKFDMEEIDPIGYSNVLSEYSQVLKHSDASDKAKSIDSKIRELKEKNPNNKAGYVSELYSSNCT